MFVWFFFFKQKTAYEMRISDWSSDVCSSDLVARSLEARTILSVEDLAYPTECDALQTPQTWPINFAVLRARGARGRGDAGRGAPCDAGRFRKADRKSVV